MFAETSCKGTFAKPVTENSKALPVFQHMRGATPARPPTSVVGCYSTAWRM